MSDPLSIAAGVVGLLTAAAQISSLLINFTKNAHDAPHQAQLVLTEVTDTSGILSHLQSFLLGTATTDQSRTSLIQVNQVIAIVTGCVGTFSELQELLDGLKCEDLGILDRIKWARKESGISTIIGRLQTHKASLSLMLSILNGATIQDAKVSMNQLCITMNEMYQEIATRLQTMEQRLPQQLNTDCLTVAEDDNQPITNFSRPLQERAKAEPQSESIFGFTFDEDLQASRVYRRTASRKSLSSLSTRHAHTTSWSVLSGLSIAEVSNISIISLAIDIGEVYRPLQYVTVSARDSPFVRDSRSMPQTLFGLSIYTLSNPQRFESKTDPMFTVQSVDDFWISTNVLKGDYPFLSYYAGEDFVVYDEQDVFLLAVPRRGPKIKGWIRMSHFMKLEAGFWTPQATLDGELFYLNTRTGVSIKGHPLFQEQIYVDPAKDPDAITHESSYDKIVVPFLAPADLQGVKTLALNIKLKRLQEALQPNLNHTKKTTALFGRRDLSRIDSRKILQDVFKTFSKNETRVDIHIAAHEVRELMLRMWAYRIAFKGPDTIMIIAHFKDTSNGMLPSLTPFGKATTHEPAFIPGEFGFVSPFGRVRIDLQVRCAIHGVQSFYVMQDHYTSQNRSASHFRTQRLAVGNDLAVCLLDKLLDFTHARG